MTSATMVLNAARIPQMLYANQTLATVDSVLHPVGAYDAREKKVLMMDPDRDLFEPYWMPEEMLVESMQEFDSVAHKTRGYLLIKPNGLH